MIKSDVPFASHGREVACVSKDFSNRDALVIQVATVAWQLLVGSHPANPGFVCVKSGQ